MARGAKANTNRQRGLAWRSVRDRGRRLSDTCKAVCFRVSLGTYKRTLSIVNAPGCGRTRPWIHSAKDEKAGRIVFAGHNTGVQLRLTEATGGEGDLASGQCGLADARPEALDRSNKSAFRAHRLRRDALRNRVAQRILSATCRAARLKMGRPEDSVPHQDLPHEAQAPRRLRTLKPATRSRQLLLSQDQAPQGRITQEFNSEDLLERIFAGFCIGK